MTVAKIAEILKGEILAGNAEEEIKHFYAGDFLSHVIAGAPTGCAWFTIMNNINVAGVAVMADIKVIVMCESVQPLAGLVEKCALEGIAVITTPLAVFDCAARVASNL